MGLFGGSSSASNTLSNIISYSPNLTLGNDNKSDLATKLDQRASSEALAKDTMSASVGVGVGGGSGSGGTVTPTENNQRKSSVFDGSKTDFSPFKSDNKLLLYGGIVAGVGVFLFVLKKKKVI